MPEKVQKPKIKIPKTLGRCADRLYEIKDEMSKLRRQLDKLLDEKTAIGEHLIRTLPKDEARGVSGTLARACIKTEQIVRVSDWDSFYKYISRTKSFDMLQRRVNDKAVKARWEDNKKVPGTEPFTYPKVGLNKL